MIILIAWLVAAISTVAFLTLWFRIVYKELTMRKNTAESAELQLAVFSKKRMQAKDITEKQSVQDVLDRSFDIYLQAVFLYNQTLQKPWNYIPGRIMGFTMLNAKMM